MITTLFIFQKEKSSQAQQDCKRNSESENAAHGSLSYALDPSTLR
jgi:hypothetical protein